MHGSGDDGDGGGGDGGGSRLVLLHKTVGREKETEEDEEGEKVETKGTLLPDAVSLKRVGK